MGLCVKSYMFNISKQITEMSDTPSKLGHLTIYDYQIIIRGLKMSKLPLLFSYLQYYKGPIIPHSI